MELGVEFGPIRHFPKQIPFFLSVVLIVWQSLKLLHCPLDDALVILTSSIDHTLALRMELFNLVDFARMGRNGLSDHALLFSLESAQFEDVDVAIERSGEDGLVEDGHVGELGKVEVVVGRRRLLALVEREGSVVEDVGGLDGIVDVELPPFDGLNQGASHGIDGVRNFPNVVVPLFSLFNID